MVFFAPDMSLESTSNTFRVFSSRYDPEAGLPFASMPV
jgi:hypothetical protein